MAPSFHVTRCVVMVTLFMTSSQLGHHHGRPKFRVEEQLPVGHVVGTVTQMSEDDNDGGGRSYALLSVHCPDTDDEKCSTLFTLNSESGVIQTADVIDRERLCNSFRTRQLCVLSLDLVIQPRFHVVTVDIEIVDVNDHAPSFGANSTTRHVIESAVPGHAVFLLPVAVDQDGGDNGAVEYQLVPPTSPFRLVVGQERASQLAVELVEPLDRETTYVRIQSLRFQLRERHNIKFKCKLKISSRHALHHLERHFGCAFDAIK